MTGVVDVGKVSFIVPAFNAIGTLQESVASIRAAAHDIDHEVVIADDGSLDDTYRLAQQLGDTVVLRPCQGGAARARNDAVLWAAGDVLFFVDADVAVTQQAVRGLLDHIRAGADAAFGGYTPLPPEHVRNGPTIYKNLVHHFTHVRHGVGPVFTFWSGFSAIRREAFDAVQGFDPAVTRSADVEDIHLGYRLTAVGARIVLDPTCLVQHNKQYTFKGMLASDLFHRAIPWTRAMLELRTFSPDLNLRADSIASSALVLIAGAGVVLAPIAPAAAAGTVVVSSVCWLYLNRQFLRFCQETWPPAGALHAGAYLALVNVISSLGAVAGAGFFCLRGPNLSVRNRMKLLTDDDVHPVEVSVAVIAMGGVATAASRLPPPAPWWELLVVGTQRPALLPDHARFINAADGAGPNALRQLALDHALGGMLALLDGPSLPGAGWLDHVRAGASRGVLVLGGAFEHDRRTSRSRAAGVLWEWPWRPQIRRSWLEDHPPNNCAYATGPARRMGGFVEPGALLRRLSVFGARPLRFEPQMIVRRDVDAPLRPMTSLAKLGRLQGAAMVRYYDNGVALRIARAAVAPVRLVVRLGRTGIQAAREGTADKTFIMALPQIVIGMAWYEFGAVVGYLRPGRLGGDIPLVPDRRAAPARSRCRPLNGTV